MRVFVALSLPEVWLAAIERAKEELRVTAAPAAAPAFAAALAAKWVAPEALHLTLAFLGDLDDGLLDRLANRLEVLAGEVGSFAWRISGCGAFFGSGRAGRSGGRGARVLWCQVDGGEGLSRLAAKVAAACDEVAPGARDAKPFRPHITVARCDPPWPAAAVARFQAAFAALPAEPARATEAVLWRSELKPGAALHTPLRRLRLGEAVT
jgi:2'-5' RNA ligase